MITVYTSKTCAYCVMVKKFLDRKGKEYTTIDVEENPEAYQKAFEATKSLTVPLTEVDGHYVIGWNPIQLAKLL